MRVRKTICKLRLIQLLITFEDKTEKKIIKIKEEKLEVKRKKCVLATFDKTSNTRTQM